MFVTYNFEMHANMQLHSSLLTRMEYWRNFSAIVYIAVRIHVMFDYMNHNIGFFMEKKIYVMIYVYA